MSRSASVPSAGRASTGPQTCAPSHYGVAVGGFGEPGFAEPSRAVWTESKHPWVRFPDGLPAFEKGTPPPTPEKL